MNLMLEQKILRPISNAWLIASYGCLLPFCFLLFHDGWYGIGWGRIGWPLILMGVIVGFACSLWIVWKGAWWQKICAVPALLWFGNFALMFALNFVRMLLS